MEPDWRPLQDHLHPKEHFWLVPRVWVGGRSMHFTWKQAFPACSSCPFPPQCSRSRSARLRLAVRAGMGHWELDILLSPYGGRKSHERIVALEIPLNVGFAMLPRPPQQWNQKQEIQMVARICVGPMFLACFLSPFGFWFSGNHFLLKRTLNSCGVLICFYVKWAQS